jgi:hypothetical protein
MDLDLLLTKEKPRCFIYGGPHYARECTKREKLNVIMVNESEPEETVMHVNPIRVLNWYQSTVYSVLRTWSESECHQATWSRFERDSLVSKLF